MKQMQNVQFKARKFTEKNIKKPFDIVFVTEGTAHHCYETFKTEAEATKMALRFTEQLQANFNRVTHFIEEWPVDPAYAN